VLTLLWGSGSWARSARADSRSVCPPRTCHSLSSAWCSPAFSSGAHTEEGAAAVAAVRKASLGTVTSGCPPAISRVATALQP
jgi:hypothetical protein